MRVPAYDAWVLARILADQPVDGEIAGVSETFRPLAERLAAAPVAGRKALLRTVSTSLPDAFGLIRAICEAEPGSPAPDRDADRISHGLPIRLTRAADIRARPVEWLWQDRVPLGMLSLWAGAPSWARATCRCRWPPVSRAAPGAALAGAPGAGPRHPDVGRGRPGPDHHPPARRRRR